MGRNYLGYTGIRAVNFGDGVVPLVGVTTDRWGQWAAEIQVPGLAARPVAVTTTPPGGVTSFLVETSALTPAAALAGVEGKYLRVWHLDTASRTWELHNPDHGAVNDLKAMVKGEVYFILMKEEATLVFSTFTYTLREGWNIVSWQG